MVEFVSYRKILHRPDTRQFESQWIESSACISCMQILKLLLGRCWRIYEGFTNWLINDWKRTKWQALNFSSRAARAPIPLVLQKTKTYPIKHTGAKKTTLQFQSWTLTIFACCFFAIYCPPWSCCVYCVASVCLLWIFTSHSWHANLHMPSNMKSTSLNKRPHLSKRQRPQNFRWWFSDKWVVFKNGFDIRL